MDELDDKDFGKEANDFGLIMLKMRSLLGDKSYREFMEMVVADVKEVVVKTICPN